ncbi:hypothetical protein MRB53_035058 [Persea americana]|uniref:Uncharacterized protein n=1 Tax=Persea americana TaxID=3435 RepID=A0ACC2K3J1_PERAE|nr:hypothetical protein MRB53_035058 [Persea americana]
MDSSSLPETPQWNIERPFLTGRFHQEFKHSAAQIAGTKGISSDSFRVVGATTTSTSTMGAMTHSSSSGSHCANCGGESHKAEGKERTSKQGITCSSIDLVQAKEEDFNYQSLLGTLREKIDHKKA